MKEVFSPKSFTGLRFLLAPFTRSRLMRIVSTVALRRSKYPCVFQGYVPVDII